MDYYRGTWSASGDLRVSEEVSAALRLVFFGRSATLTLGVGPDYGICDVHVNGMLWQGFDNYAANAGEDAISLTLQGDGPHVLEVRNRAEKNKLSVGYKVAFKQLVSDSEHDLHTILYQYDGLSRLLSADYYAGENLSATPYLQYAYEFDLAGNRTLKDVDGTQTTYTYNAANQITNTGFTYDDAGRMTSVGVNTYVWDRAVRLLSMGGISYAYDGAGNRISLTANSTVTEYLNDVQPGLTKVLAETTSGNTIRFVHGPRGIQGVEDSAGAWAFPVQDGLGSVRSDGLGYSPYGVPNDAITGFAFTGEMRDANGLQYHRARYYAPELGVWASLDTVEGMVQRAMSLNGYSWVEGNPINAVDPSGKNRILHRLEGICGIPTLGSNDNEYCGFPESSGFRREDREEIARILAAIAFQQNRFVGYEAMVLTMVAAINSLDRGNTTLSGLQQSQHPYSHAGCEVAALDACIDAKREASRAIVQHGRNSEQAQSAIQSRELICFQVDRDNLYSCVSDYMDFALAGGEPYPENSGELAQQTLWAARRLLAGRCSRTHDSGALFSNSELRDTIREMDSNDRMQYVFSFDVSWYDDLPKWSSCVAQRIGSELEYISLRSYDSHRAVFISSDFNPLCEDFQNPKGTRTSACGCDFVEN